jgi:hypothetical protein
MTTATTRIAALLHRLGGVPEASRKTGIATSTLYQYADQGFVTAADHLVALVEADGASVGMCTAYVRPRGTDGLVVSRPRRRPKIVAALAMETD